jgi:hypothetical protein
MSPQSESRKPVPAKGFDLGERQKKKLTKSDWVKTEDYFKERVLVVEEEVLGRGEE